MIGFVKEVEKMIKNCDENYFDLVNDVLKNGVEKEDRTGVGVLSVFGRQTRYDISKKFPLLTTKKIHWKSVVGELLWFLKGDTNIKYLNNNNITIWNEWADNNGDLGPIYGKQWRSWPSYVEAKYADLHGSERIFNKKIEIDQLNQIIEEIKKTPNSRRLVVSAWNVGQLKDMALQPCHVMFQFYVRNNKLSCQLYQRSCDLGLGQPFNVASYSLLTHLIAQVCGLDGVDEFIHTIGDLHIYKNHIMQLQEQLARVAFESPTIEIDKTIKNIDLFDFQHIKLIDYNSHSSIKMKVAV